MKAPRASKAVTEKFKKAVEDYSGGKVVEIECYADPQVSGCYVARTKFDNGNEEFWLKSHSDEISEETIEEAEFDVWPPVSDKTRFFA